VFILFLYFLGHLLNKQEEKKKVWEDEGKNNGWQGGEFWVELRRCRRSEGACLSMEAK
jgi:hypothetical protein